MILLPLQLLLSLFLGLLAVGMIIASAYLFYKALKRPVVVSREAPGKPAVLLPMSPSLRDRRRQATLLGSALLLLLLGFGGRRLVSIIRPSSPDDAQHISQPSRKIPGASGAELVIEESGPPDGIRLIFTHGWGLDRRVWDWARKDLSQQFRVITWDLPGLGQSAAIPNRDYSLETLAKELHVVAAQTGNTPVVLVGHSIGGMINLTFCRVFPQQLGQPIAGIVELNTTYTNPIKTTQGAALNEALQKPLFEPLLHVITFLSPAVRVLNWLSYQSGLTHLQNASQSFAGAETREQLDFTSQYSYQSSPAIVARGTLGMLHWDATAVLSQIAVPVLIVTSEQDTTTLPSARDFMAMTIPGSKKLSISPAAHLGPIEQNTRYNEAIRDFAEIVLEAGGNSKNWASTFVHLSALLVEQS